jgi:hypothetical protein
LGVYGRHNTLAEILQEAGFPCRTEVPLAGHTIIPADILDKTFRGGMNN